MTDATAQQSLLPGLLAAAGLHDGGGLPGSAAAVQAAIPAAAGLADKGFQEQLRQLLARAPGENAAPLATTEELSLPATAAAPPPSLPVAAAPADEGTAGLPPEGGRTLPEGGNRLPPAGPLLPLLRQAAPSVAAAPAVEVLPEARPAAPQSRPAAATEAQPPAQSAETRVRPGLMQSVNDMAMPRPAEPPALAVDQPAPRVAGGQPAVAAPLVQNVADSLRRINPLQPDSHRLHASVTATGETAARRDALHRLPEQQASRTPRVSSAGETPGAYHPSARGADLLNLPLTASASPESVLRDLQNMTPLRPQSGESAQGWSAGLGQRLLMMAENGVEVARLRLTPAHLGPLEIHVNVEEDRAQVWFGAQHSQTRDALESALPRLREMFAEQGLELTQADVEDRGQRETGAEKTGDALPPDAPALDIGGAAVFAMPAGGGMAASGSLDIYV